jgi:hypothetical protein
MKWVLVLVFAALLASGFAYVRWGFFGKNPTGDSLRDKSYEAGVERITEQQDREDSIRTAKADSVARARHADSLSQIQ